MGPDSKASTRKTCIQTAAATLASAKYPFRRRRHLGSGVFRAPSQGVGSSFFCWIAGQRLAQKEYMFHRHRYVQALWFTVQININAEIRHHDHICKLSCLFVAPHRGRKLRPCSQALWFVFLSLFADAGSYVCMCVYVYIYIYTHTSYYYYYYHHYQY